jgi:hypothetical protein
MTGMAFGHARENIKLTNQDLQDFADSVVADVKTAFTDDFAQGLADMMNGVESFEDSWKGAVTTVLEGLQQIILKMMLMAVYNKFVAPALEGAMTFLGIPLAKQTSSALMAPSSFAAGQTIVVQSSSHFHAGFVDPSGADEFFSRNSSRLKEFTTAATVEALERSPAFRARVRR